MLQRYTYKLIISGNVSEVYAYYRPQYKRIDDKTSESIQEDKLAQEVDKARTTIKQNDSDKEENRNSIRLQENINRTKRRLQRLIHANINQYETTDKFLTLTFPNEDGKEPTREWVCYRFKEFKRKMYKKYGKFEYIAIIERGSKASERLHLHIICFGLAFIRQKELQKIWGGIVDIRKIYQIPNGLYGVADYMTKYIQKTLVDGEYIGKGKRFYFPSKQLKKPIEVILVDEEIGDYINDLGVEIMSVTFDSEYVGTCTYSKYNKLINTIEWD